MGGRLFTDKLVFRWLEVLGVWSLDSATPATSAYPAHASGSSQLLLLILHTQVARRCSGREDQPSSRRPSQTI